MNIPNPQRSKASARLRGHRATLEKSKISVVDITQAGGNRRKKPLNQVPGKLCLETVMPIQIPISKPKIINALDFSPGQTDLNARRNV